jgi:hypothetical protein
VNLSVAERYVGGIAAGLPPRTTSVASESLAPQDAAALRAHVEAADLFNLPPRIGPAPTQPQAVDYEFTVEDDGRRHTVAVVDQAMPAPLQALLSWLRSVPGREEQAGP